MFIIFYRHHHHIFAQAEQREYIGIRCVLESCVRAQVNQREVKTKNKKQTVYHKLQREKKSIYVAHKFKLK